MGFYGCIPRFIKAHAGWILTGLGIAGLGGTAVLTAKAAPRAKAAVDNADGKKRYSEFYDWASAGNDGHDFEEKGLTFWEKFKIAAPYYIPAIITGTVTAGCMIGCQMINVKQQAALLAAYAALGTEYDKYRSEIRKEYGEEADKKALISARAEVARLTAEVKTLEAQTAPLLYGIETLPGVVFEAHPIDIQESFMHWNRDLVLGGENTLDELYRFIGIPESAYDVGEAEEYGCNAYEDEVDWGMSYVDFGLEGIVNRDGQIVHMITFSIPPYRLGGDWGAPGETSIEERIYPGYQPKRARELARNFSESDGVNRRTKISHQPIYAMNGYLHPDCYEKEPKTINKLPDNCLVSF